MKSLFPFEGPKKAVLYLLLTLLVCLRNSYQGFLPLVDKMQQLWKGPKLVSGISAHWCLLQSCGDGTINITTYWSCYYYAVFS